MGFSIAVAGKGRHPARPAVRSDHTLFDREKARAVLAVDADANSNLNDVLGVNVHATVGSCGRPRSKRSSPRHAAGGMSMEQLFDYQISRRSSRQRASISW